ncbi:quinolinate synthase NadA [Candidatus Avelusimicrobium facis]|uniref:quinolinate synthase NadA n=1 Tax=Candidatus Avelusimicrobium facis TaxID=3416203 RepID=UPI003D110788
MSDLAVNKEELLQQEAHRLYGLLASVSRSNGVKWSYTDCLQAAPYTLGINQIKKEQNAVILAHSYTVPELGLGVADISGDSYALSLKAREVTADKIIFAGVWFMAETAKILNPSKQVIIPAGKAGCTLADSMTQDEVRRLKAEHPGAPVLCYVNSTAGVKAESDICVTSGNVFDIAAKLPQKELIFVPDLLMAQNIENELKRRGLCKKIISSGGSCCVHDKYTPDHVAALRRDYPGIVVLAHPECRPDVCAAADYVGSTKGMQDFVNKSGSKLFGLLTEFGLVNRLEAAHPDKRFVWPFGLCAYMKKNSLANTFQALLEPRPDQIVSLPEDVMNRARKSLQNMFEMTR